MKLSSTMNVFLKNGNNLFVKDANTITVEEIQGVDYLNLMYKGFFRKEDLFLIRLDEVSLVVKGELSPEMIRYISNYAVKTNEQSLS